MSTHHLLAMPIDEHAALLMWAEYSAIHTETVTLCPDYTVEHFGDSAELADPLLHEVNHGSKPRNLGAGRRICGSRRSDPACWLTLDSL